MSILPQEVAYIIGMASECMKCGAVILYAAARGYMVIEVFVNLRELPLDKTVEVAQILPHW